MKYLLMFAMLALSSIGTYAANLSNANIDSRLTRYHLSFSDLTFQDASYFVSTDLQFHGNVGDSATFQLVGFGQGKVINVNSGSGISITNLTAANASGFIFYTATIIGAANQTINQSWSVASQPATQGQTFRLTRDTLNGFNTLELKAASSGFLKVGGPFDIGATIPGDWSSLGNATGQVQFVSKSATLTTTEGFTFSSGQNLTTYSAINSNYNNGTEAFDFILFGTPVPEPSTSLLFAVAICAFAAIRLPNPSIRFSGAA